MNINEYFSQNQGKSDQDYVTRQEMASIVVALVQHYEKRISTLEHQYQSLLGTISAQKTGNNQNMNNKNQKNSSNVLQSNSNHLNQSNIPNNRLSNPNNHLHNDKESTRQSEVLSTENSESSLNPVVTIKSFNMIDELQSMLNPSTGIYSRTNQSNQKSKKPAAFNSHEKVYYNMQENNAEQTTSYQQKQQRQKSQSNVSNIAQNSQQQNNCFNNKAFKKENYSEIKNKISMFNLHPFQSPTDTSFKKNDSPDRTIPQSEYVKQFQSSPDSFMNGCQEKGQGSNLKQMISICTQDYQITEVQSPLNEAKMQGRQESKAKSVFQKGPPNFQIAPSSGMSIQNQLQHNVSLSILLEEESQAQQLISGLGKDLNCSTYDARNTIKDQRLSLGGPNGGKQQTQNLQKQRSTTSLGNKSVISTSSNIQSNLSKPSIKSSQNAHCMIQKHQKLKNQLNSNQQQQKTLQQKQMSQLVQSVTSNQHEKSRQHPYTTLDQERKMISTRKPSQGPSSRKSQQKMNSNTHNSIRQDQSIAKILMPQLAQERLFTPLGLNRSKTPINVTGYQSDYPKKSGLNPIHTTHSSRQRDQPQAMDIEEEEIENKENTYRENEQPSSAKEEIKPLDTSNREPLTMRDLDNIEQNQFKLTVNSAQNSLACTAMRSFDDTSKEETGKFDKINSKKGSLRSSLIATSRNHNPDLSTDEILIGSGSQTQRESSQQSFNNDNQLKKKRSVGRLINSTAETRLQNLVQTIQKYKNEQGMTPSSSNGTSESLQQQNKQGDTLKTFKNFEYKDEFYNHEGALGQIKQCDSKGSQRSKTSKGSKDSRESKGHRAEIMIKDESSSSKKIGGMQELDDDMLLDNFDLHNGIIKLNQVIPICSSNNDTTSSKAAQSKHSKKNSQSSCGKSRNQQAYQEYFSFSNLEREELEKIASIKDFDEQMQKMNIQSLTNTSEAQTLERCETMVKLTFNNSNEYKTKFTDLTGDVLDIISEYLTNNEKQLIPVFVITNSLLLKNFVDYKRENYSIQNEILVDQIAELKKELFDYFDQKLFKMSKGLSIIYYSNINSKEWITLEELASTKQLSKEDIVLLKVYLILLGTQPKQGSNDLQDQLYKLISEHKNRLNQIFNPELHFTFGPQILCQVGQLLQTFSLENYIINYSKQQQSQSRKIRTLQILAQIIYEALQFCKIVPNRIESDIRELERVIDHYNQMQDQLDKFKQIKNN